MRKKLFSSFTFMFATSAIFFLFNFVLAKLLGAEDYGKIIYYTVFIQIIALLIGLNYAGLYMGRKILYEDNSTFSLFITLESLMFLILSVPMFFTIHFFIENTLHTVLLLFIAYTGVMLITASLEYNVEGYVSSSIAVGTLIPRVLLSSIFLFCIWWGYQSIEYYLYIYLSANIFVVLWVLYKFRPKYFLDFSVFQRGWKFYTIGLIGTGFTYIAQIIQKEYGSYEGLASLALAILLISSLNLVGSVLIKFVLPKIHRAWKIKDMKKIETIYHTHTFVSVMINLPILFYLLWNMNIFTLYLGEGYRQLPAYFYILSVGYLFDLFTGITGSILRATEYEMYEIYNEIVRFVSGGVILLLWHDDSYVVAYAISGSTLFYNIAKYIQIYAIFHFKPIKINDLIIIFTYMSVLAVLLYIVSYFDGIVSLGMGVLVLCIIYLGMYKNLRKKISVEVYQ